MSLVVGVRFDAMGKLYYFDPGTLDLEPGDSVIVETEKGEKLGEVVTSPQEVADTSTLSTLKKVIRLAEPHEVPAPSRDREKEAEAFRIGEEKIRNRKLDMKLIDVEYAPDGSRLIFYFSADGRIDFRELVRDLASVFRMRIELRQIGVRDEAKKLGGLGPCGRPCCCNAHMDDFVPVSIKMAKDQGLSLSPTKISGLCGRLMCCLHYEQEHYHAMRKIVPRPGSYVESPAGPGEVVSADVLTGRTKIRIAIEDGSYEQHTFALEELSPYEGSAPPGPVAKKEPEKPAADFAPAHRKREARRPQGQRPKERQNRNVPKGEKRDRRKDGPRKEGKPERRRRPYRPRRPDGSARKSGSASGPKRSS